VNVSLPGPQRKNPRRRISNENPRDGIASWAPYSKDLNKSVAIRIRNYTYKRIWTPTSFSAPFPCVLTFLCIEQPPPSALPFLFLINNPHIKMIIQSSCSSLPLKHDSSYSIPQDQKEHIAIP